MTNHKPLDSQPRQCMDIPNSTNHEHKTRQSLDNLIHSKPKPDETEKEFLVRKKVIKY